MSEHPVTLEEMLAARERRVQRQQRLLAEYHVTLICFTMNIAGPIKNSPLIRSGFACGNQQLREKLAGMHRSCLRFEEYSEATGNEAYYLIADNALAVKRLTVSIEDGSAANRLFDMDVLDSKGIKTERSRLGLAPRTCLLCGRPAGECARSRRHTLEELQAQTELLLRELSTASQFKGGIPYA